jgi:hypothetical protein
MESAMARERTIGPNQWPRRLLLGGAATVTEVRPAVATTALGAQARSPTAAARAVGTCNPSFPAVCIQPPQDLDCKDVPSPRFDVVGLAPHGLDRDRDGVGCDV